MPTLSQRESGDPQLRSQRAGGKGPLWSRLPAVTWGVGTAGVTLWGSLGLDEVMHSREAVSSSLGLGDWTAWCGGPS